MGLSHEKRGVVPELERKRKATEDQERMTQRERTAQIIGL